MAQYKLQVVGHGKDISMGTFPVAKHFTFKFYVNDGQVLSNELSDSIYCNLNKGDEKKDKVVETLTHGAQVKNYGIWAFKDYYRGKLYKSGILEVGTGRVIVDLDECQDINENKPMWLSNLLALAVEEQDIKIGVDEVIVYYNACR